MHLLVLCFWDDYCRKLIGARYFNKGFASVNGQLNSSYETALDHEGHGSHTLSTAGGNFVPGANVFGLGNGTAKGGSPSARVAAYKVCWPPINDTGGCYDADILAGFDMAIHDGVDVISVSVGKDSVSNYFEDGMSIGAFHAVKEGIVVVCSAGNAGPTPGSVTNVSPWMVTVGASTLDREFQAFVELQNGLRFKVKLHVHQAVFPPFSFFKKIAWLFDFSNLFWNFCTSLILGRKPIKSFARRPILLAY